MERKKLLNDLPAEVNQQQNLSGLEMLERAADYIVKSGLFGVNSKEQAVALMLLAQAEGLHPMKAVQEYYIIQGRPALRADAMLARFQRAGGKIEWHELSDKRARATFTHPQGGSVTIEWTIEMARQAGLLDKTGSNWKRYPRAMLRARVISEGVRTVFPGVATGIYTPEEVMDFDEVEVQQQDQQQQQEKEEEKQVWNREKIAEVASEELKRVVKENKVKTKELITLFEKHNGDQKAIIKEIKGGQDD